MKFEMAATFLELGDATSCNLAYSHRQNEGVSYGEETITETNLLEIRRRHPKHVHLHTFSRHAESRNGADWERHIVGRRRTLKMRVQAKRVQRNKVLKIAHEVKSSGGQQRDLLGMALLPAISNRQTHQIRWLAQIRRANGPKKGEISSEPVKLAPTPVQ